MNAVGYVSVFLGGAVFGWTSSDADTGDGEAQSGDGDAQADDGKDVSEGGDEQADNEQNDDAEVGEDDGGENEDDADDADDAEQEIDDQEGAENPDSQPDCAVVDTPENACGISPEQAVQMVGESLVTFDYESVVAGIENNGEKTVTIRIVPEEFSQGIGQRVDRTGEETEWDGTITFGPGVDIDDLDDQVKQPSGPFDNEDYDAGRGTALERNRADWEARVQYAPMP